MAKEAAEANSKRTGLAKSVCSCMRGLTWPCIVIMKAVLERVQTKMWSTFCGLECMLSTARSVPACPCGGLKDVRQSQDLASHTLTVLSLDPVITYM